MKRQDEKNVILNAVKNLSRSVRFEILRFAQDDEERIRMTEGVSE